MRRRMALGLGATMALIARAGAQAPPERERVFCDPADPCNQCPGRFCTCLDGTLEVTFEGGTASVLEYEAFEENTRIDTFIVIDTESRGIQGWSYAVEHEDAFLTLLQVTVDGTEAELAKDGGFVVADMFDIEACPPADPYCTRPVPGAGYISAVALHFTDVVELPPGRNRICAATYALKADPGPNGTLIQVVDDRLKKKGLGPQVDLVFTIDGPTGTRSSHPARIIDGWLKRKGEGALESCDNQVDDDGDGRTDCQDWDCLSWSNCIPAGRAPDGTHCGPENCGNSKDDDGDGLTDCGDWDCEPLCREDCFNSLDDDGDGLTDCKDPYCLVEQACVSDHEEVCDDDIDEDQDGFFDCHDTDCAGSPICFGPERCRSLRDEDQDGLIDCADPDCAAADDCLPGPGRTRLFCDLSDRQNRCFGEPSPEFTCKCSPDVLQVALGGETESVLEVEGFQEGARIDSTIVLDTKSAGIQGWSFAVEHDGSFLTLLGATVDGTDAGREFQNGFQQISTRLIEACEPGDPGCAQPVEGSGYVVGVVLGLWQEAELRPGRRNSLCRAEYALKADPGPDGTLVRIVDRRLKLKNSPPISVNLTINGRSKLPTALIDGWVKAPSAAGAPGSQATFRRGDVDRSGNISVLDAITLTRILLGHAEPAFHCDDALDVTDDGRVDVIDTIRLLQFLIERGSELPAPFPGCGPDPTTEPRDLACRESSCAET